MEFKKRTQKSLNYIYKINRQMLSRIRSHGLKMSHLSYMFDQEVSIMRAHYLETFSKKGKNKKIKDNKEIARSLQRIQE